MLSRASQMANGKESTCQCRRPKRCRLIPGWGRSPGVENDNYSQYCCVKNFMDRGAWGPWGLKESDMIEWMRGSAYTHTHTHTHNVLSTAYCPLYHPHNKEKDTASIWGEMLRLRDPARNQLWFPLTLKSQFLIATPRDLERLRAAHYGYLLRGRKGN